MSWAPVFTGVTTFYETVVLRPFCFIFNFITSQSPVKSLGSPKIFLPVF